MNKKPVVIFSVADDNNFPYAVMLFNSLTKFHSPKEIDMVLYTTEKRPDKLKQLPQGIKIEDLTPYLKQDPMFFYRQKPVLGEPLLDEYELVLGMDSDQIVTGKLDYIFNTKDYDIGTVINWNRTDPQYFGLIAFQGIMPPEYFNCGLVAMRSKKFAHHWKVLCFSPQFDRLQFKEQDLLNVLCYYGNYNVRCFDNTDGIAKYFAWHGLIAKGELIRAVMQGDDILIPKGLGDTPFPPVDIQLKVIHTGGGNMPNKMNYKTWFSSEEVTKRIDYLVSPTK